jgi:ATP/maltotriose-dependent transcriptional regulator MalT
VLIQQNTLLATKLHIPHLRMDVVQRPRLTRRLNEGATRKLTFVTAPAGFGKTTLLTEWATQCRLATAWISLHPMIITTPLLQLPDRGARGFAVRYR